MAFGLGKRSKTRRTVAKRTAAQREEATLRQEEVGGPSPDPVTNLVLADIVLRSAGTLARIGVERALLGRKYTPEKARHVLDGRSMRESLIGAALARVATRSVPGAIVVSGGMLAKTLYDRHRGKKDGRVGGKGKRRI